MGLQKKVSSRECRHRKHSKFNEIVVINCSRAKLSKFHWHSKWLSRKSLGLGEWFCTVRWSPCNICLACTLNDSLGFIVGRSVPCQAFSSRFCERAQCLLQSSLQCGSRWSISLHHDMPIGCFEKRAEILLLPFYVLPKDGLWQHKRVSSFYLNPLQLGQKSVIISNLSRFPIPSWVTHMLHCGFSIWLLPPLSYLTMRSHCFLGCITSYQGVFGCSNLPNLPIKHPCSGSPNILMAGSCNMQVFHRPRWYSNYCKTKFLALDMKCVFSFSSPRTSWGSLDMSVLLTMCFLEEQELILSLPLQVATFSK